MKILYITIIALLFTQWGVAQSVNFEIVKNSDLNYSIMALPSKDMPEKIIVSDIGLSIVLPSSAVEIINLSSLQGRIWSKLSVDATTMGRHHLELPFEKLIVLNLSPTTTSEIYFEKDFIELVNFDLSAPLTNGTMTIVSRKEANATVLGSALFPFFNAKNERAEIEDFYSKEPLSDENGISGTLEYRLFPNPTREIVYLKGDVSNLQQIDIFNPMGQLVKQISTGFSEINISELKTGLYLFRLHHKNTKVTSKTIIKQ